jgi:hypothetical protein
MEAQQEQDTRDAAMATKIGAIVDELGALLVEMAQDEVSEVGTGEGAAGDEMNVEMMAKIEAIEKQIAESKVDVGAIAKAVMEAMQGGLAPIAEDVRKVADAEKALDEKVKAMEARVETVERHPAASGHPVKPAEKTLTGQQVIEAKDEAPDLTGAIEALEKANVLDEAQRRTLRTALAAKVMQGRAR